MWRETSLEPFPDHNMFCKPNFCLPYGKLQPRMCRKAHFMALIIDCNTLNSALCNRYGQYGPSDWCIVSLLDFRKLCNVWFVSARCLATRRNTFFFFFPWQAILSAEGCILCSPNSWHTHAITLWAGSRTYLYKYGILYIYCWCRSHKFCLWEIQHFCCMLITMWYTEKKKKHGCNEHTNTEGMRSFGNLYCHLFNISPQSSLLSSHTAFTVTSHYTPMTTSEQFFKRSQIQDKTEQSLTMVSTSMVSSIKKKKASIRSWWITHWNINTM